MLHQVGLNHIFDNGTICFCLVCKDSITENYPLDRYDAIRQHFRSEDHEKSSRNLFKICVPDPQCESRNIKYLDIVNNSEFEVWEQGNEQSYVSKRDNLFMCLICKEGVSEVCEKIDKTKHNLQYHLGSEVHIDNVKNSIWWTYHPNLDTNYIALNKIFMYCSFCQKLLESKENSLLEFAANHIETELIKIRSVNASNLKLEETYSNDGSEPQEPMPEYASKIKIKNQYSYSKTEQTNTSSVTVLKIDLEGANSNDIFITEHSELKKTILDSASKVQLEETNSNDASTSQLESNLKPITCKPGSMIENLLTTTTRPIEISKDMEISQTSNVNNNVIVANSEINLNQVTVESEKAVKSLPCEGLNIRPTMVSNIFMEELAVYPEFHEQVEVFNDDVSSTLHSQKHKDLSFVNFDIECEIKKKLDLDCPLCQKKIEVFNKDLELSYNIHLDDCHPDSRNHLYNIKNTNYDYITDEKLCKESCIIADAYSLLPNNVRDHLTYITCDGINLKCVLCNCILCSSNDLTVACNVLQNHFSEFFHKTQFEVYDNVEDDQVFEEDCQLFVGLQFNRSKATNQTGSSGMFVKNKTLEQYSTNERTLKVHGGTARPRLKVLEILCHLVDAHPLVDENKHFLGEKAGHFNCNLCNEILRCTRSGSKLIEHLNGESHLTNPNKGIEKRIKGKVRTRPEVLDILKGLSICNNVVDHHIDNIGEKNGHFFCKPCGEVIMCTLSGRKLVDHLNGLNHFMHTEKSKEEQRELKSKARSDQQVYNILWRLISKKEREVSKNIEFLGEKQGYFYCEICNVMVQCTPSGSKLIAHLRDPKHELNFVRHTSNDLQ